MKSPILILIVLLKWLGQNFSLHYPYHIKQTSNENKENINQGIIDWSNSKFSKLAWHKLHADSKEN